MRHIVVRVAYCPACGNETYFHFQREFQGEGPMGGYRLFFDNMIKDCECCLTAEQEDDMEFSAEDCDD